MDNNLLIAMIPSVVALIGTCVGSWMGIRQANKLVNWRIDKLEEEMKKQNNLVERLATLEAIVEEAQQRLNKMVDMKMAAHG